MKVFISDGCVGFYGYMAESKFFVVVVVVVEDMHCCVFWNGRLDNEVGCFFSSDGMGKGRDCQAVRTGLTNE